ncbi:MAG: PaaI family thioesterase [Pyrinomonadaceae bacterium]
MSKQVKKFIPQSPNFEVRVCEVFKKQAVMQTIGCKLVNIKPGSVELLLPFRPNLTQQNGFLHAGIISTAMDSACGFAALTLTSENQDVLAVEFKVNFLAPAYGKEFRIIGNVIKAGKTITVSQAETYAASEKGDKLVSQMTGTIFVANA